MSNPLSFRAAAMLTILSCMASGYRSGTTYKQDSSLTNHAQNHEASKKLEGKKKNQELDKNRDPPPQAAASAAETASAVAQRP